MQNNHFSLQNCTFLGKKSATKFLCAKTVSDSVPRHSLAYLTVHKWLVGCPLLHEIFCVKDLPPAKTTTSNRHLLVALQP